MYFQLITWPQFVHLAGPCKWWTYKLSLTTIFSEMCVLTCLRGKKIFAQYEELTQKTYYINRVRFVFINLKHVKDHPEIDLTWYLTQKALSTFHLAAIGLLRSYRGWHLSKVFLSGLIKYGFFLGECCYHMNNFLACSCRFFWQMAHGQLRQVFRRKIFYRWVWQTSKIRVALACWKLPMYCNKVLLSYFKRKLIWKDLEVN